MFCIVLKTLITFFAIYGLCYFISEISEFFLQCEKNISENNPVIVIKVKNHEETIECVVRNIVFGYMKKLHTSTMPDILIVDFGSDDSTPEIARALASDYPFIYYTTSELYEKATAEASDAVNYRSEE